MRILDITGEQFGRLTVLYLSEMRRGRAHWLCRCTCGKEILVEVAALRIGKTRSCGCLQKDVTAARSTTHGETTGYEYSPEYEAWMNLRRRCTDPAVWNYENYGGRGITFYPQWETGANGLTGFELFLLEIGRKPSPEHSVDRKNNALGYQPGNVKWSTPAEQARNKRNNIWVQVGDITMIVADALAHIPHGNVHFSKARNRYSLDPQAAYELVLRRHKERTESGKLRSRVR